MRRIGFSTGALALGDYRRALAMLAKHPGVKVVELSALRQAELEPLVAALDSLELSQFEYVAFHAPSVMQPGREQAVVHALDAVASRGWPIILHPDAVHDWTLWRHFGALLCIENMDKRKTTGRRREDLRACFDRAPDASLCVDLGHARQVDPTMTEPHFILSEFRGRLRQVHLSEVSTDSRHDRISFTSALGFREIAHLVPEHLPVVLETPVGPKELEEELRRAADALEPVRQTPSRRPTAEPGARDSIPASPR